MFVLLAQLLKHFLVLLTNLLTLLTRMLALLIRMLVLLTGLLTLLTRQHDWLEVEACEAASLFTAGHHAEERVVRELARPSNHDNMCDVIAPAFYSTS